MRAMTNLYAIANCAVSSTEKETSCQVSWDTFPSVSVTKFHMLALGFSPSTQR